MSRITSAMLGLGLLLLATSLWAAPPTVNAVPAPEPPVLDGQLNDAVWQRGPWYSDFSLLDQPTRRPAAQTRFKIACDERFLYIGAELDEPHMDQLVAQATEHDGHVHRDDCLEFMIVPRAARLDYYHFAVNALGTRYEAERRQGGNVSTAEWDCDWVAKTSRSAQAWTVEAAIPLVELGLDGASRGDWAINVTRERQAGGVELSSFAPTTGGFHQPSLYATLKLAGVDLSRYLWTVRVPYELGVYQEKEQLVCRAKTHLTNETGRFWFLKLVPELVAGERHSRGRAVSFGLDGGQGREVTFSVPLRQQGNQTLRLQLVDRRNPDNVLAVKSFPLSLTYTPLTLDITRPCYRDNIYATEKLERIEFGVTAALTPEQLQGSKFVAALYPRAAADQPSSGPVSAPAAAAAKLALPAAALPVGDYQLVVRVVDAAGKTTFEAAKRLRKLPPAPGGHEWRFDEHNVLLHNGEPFLPFGWFSQPPDTLDLKDGYNAVQSYSREYFSVADVRTWLDEIAGKGFFVTFSPYCREMMNRDEQLKQPLSDTERQAIANRVNALKDHRGLLAWYMADEPELRPELPQRSQELYETCRDNDPYHPCIMLNDTLEGIRTYARGGDILMPDPYPCFLKGGLAASPIEKVSQFMDRIREVSAGRQPAWITPQGFNYGDYNKQGQRGPNLTELRNMLYQAVTHGAKGFLWYTYSQLGNYPDLYLGMPFLAKEVADLKDFVLADNLPAGLTVKADQPAHLHAALRRVKGEWALLAVNTAATPQTATFTLTGGPDTLYVVSEGRSVKLVGGSFTAQFDTYGSHLYTSRPALAERESLAAVQGKIDAANAARKVAGNLAFEDSGVTVKVSSGSVYGNTPDRVVDGMRTGMSWQAKNPGKTDEWLQLTWPTEIEAGKVVLYSRTLTQAEVQVRSEGGEWRTVGQTAGQTSPLTATFAPVKTKELRILAKGLTDAKSLADLQEVEVYAR